MFQRGIFKYSIAFATLLLTFMIFGSTVMANEDISDQETLEEQIKELNEALEEIKNEVNERLEAGEEIFIVERELSFTDEPAQVEINSGNTQVSGEFGIMSTTRSANFEATLRNPMGIANSFAHRLNIDWTYNSSNSNIINVVPRSFLTGPLYYRTHDTGSSALTDAVHQVESVGRFRPYNFAVISYQTKFVINVNGTGTHQVVELYVGN